jgi:hypothetical protein
MPSFILDIAFFIRIPLVSGLAPDVTQQIHSFLASGVISPQSTFAFGDTPIAFLKSAGSVCIRAERKRFELLKRLPPCWFSKPVLSTTQPPLQMLWTVRF